MLIDEIKKSNMIALKEKNNEKRTAYSIAINKYMLQNIERRAQGKEMADADVVAILQKTVKELTEEAENYAKVNNMVEHDAVLKQREALELFIPKMMSLEEIKAEILKLEDKSIGNVMKYFKINFMGKCSMQDVQAVLKTL